METTTLAERFAEILDTSEIRTADPSVTAEYPAIGQSDLVAASTYRDEDLAIAMWQAAVLKFPIIDLATYGNANLIARIEAEF